MLRKLWPASTANRPQYHLPRRHYCRLGAVERQLMLVSCDYTHSMACANDAHEKQSRRHPTAC